MRETALVLIVFLGALLFRLPGLDSRPFHTDEANNALILEETLQQDGFHYRPHEHHGPTLFFLAELPCKMLGVNSTAQMEAWALRLLTVVCGSLAAASVLFLSPWLGRFPALIAALAVSVAAPFHYYSRTFIHESLLLLLTVWLLVALLRWRDTGRCLWVIVSGLAAGLMVATKENAAVSVMLIGWPFLLPVGGGSKIRVKGLLVAVIVSAAVPALLIGPENLWRAVFLHTQRGLDSGHNWPFHQFLLWYGSWRGPGLPWGVWIMSLSAGWAVWRWRRNPAVAPLTMAFLGLFLFHSLLPYKTPWLAVTPLALLVLLGSAGLVLALKKMPGALALTAGILLVALTLSETYSRSFTNQVRVDNPLAYSPTSEETVGLVRAADALAAQLPGRQRALIQVVAEDCWPLPWLLRKYPNKGFWREAPAQWNGDIIICSPEAIGWLPDDMPLNFTPFELRPGLTVFMGGGKPHE
ncbi:MAG: glycosyltransferase family 39 protein [Verrucomicrobiales bacterium]|jgi:predicted membrane-bound mannosyltransferase|nr:glycosyltransferase family 39 protein [Verrucomicrobiales bacterium]